MNLREGRPEEWSIKEEERKGFKTEESVIQERINKRAMKKVIKVDKKPVRMIDDSIDRKVDRWMVEERRVVGEKR